MLPIMVAQHLYCSTLEAEAWGLQQVLGQPGLQCNFKASYNSKTLSQIKPNSNKKKKKKKTQKEQKFPKNLWK